MLNAVCIFLLEICDLTMFLIVMKQRSLVWIPPSPFPLGQKLTYKKAKKEKEKSEGILWLFLLHRHETPQVEIPNAHDNAVWDLAWHPIGYLLCRWTQSSCLWSFWQSLFICLELWIIFYSGLVLLSFLIVDHIIRICDVKLILSEFYDTYK